MKKLRVLLVDDEIMIREGFKRLFDWEAHDCEVVGEAADGMDALTKIDTLQPDIAIMDINIPIMNGLKVIQLPRLLHRNAGQPDFPSLRSMHEGQLAGGHPRQGQDRAGHHRHLPLQPQPGLSGL